VSLVRVEVTRGEGWSLSFIDAFTGTGGLPLGDAHPAASY
jgi:hypothetical protein